LWHNKIIKIKKERRSREMSTVKETIVFFKYLQDSKIAKKGKISLPGRVTREQAKLILENDYGYTVIKVNSCLGQ
jgi:hypothetical protein